MLTTFRTMLTFDFISNEPSEFSRFICVSLKSICIHYLLPDASINITIDSKDLITLKSLPSIFCNIITQMNTNCGCRVCETLLSDRRELFRALLNFAPTSYFD